MIKPKKRWNEIPATSSYLHITFIDTEDEIYYTRGLNQFVKKLYEAQIFNNDGTFNESNLKLFRLENGEDEPRSAFN